MPHAAVLEGYRRAVFDMLAVNQDDHVKNQSFHFDSDGRWSLTPAYDVTFARGNEWTAAHQMRLADKRAGITREDLLGVGRAFGIRAPARILAEVGDVLARWPAFARSTGVPAGDLEGRGCRAGRAQGRGGLSRPDGLLDGPRCGSAASGRDPRGSPHCQRPRRPREGARPGAPSCAPAGRRSRTARPLSGRRYGRSRTAPRSTDTCPRPLPRWTGWSPREPERTSAEPHRPPRTSDTPGAPTSAPPRVASRSPRRTRGTHTRRSASSRSVSVTPKGNRAAGSWARDPPPGRAGAGRKSPRRRRPACVRSAPRRGDPRRYRARSAGACHSADDVGGVVPDPAGPKLVDWTWCAPNGAGSRQCRPAES
jgi:serine/threonine-protein kinase HipA